MSDDTPSEAIVLSSESEAETLNNLDNVLDFVSWLAQFSVKPSDFSGGNSDEAFDVSMPVFDGFMAEFDGLVGFNSPRGYSQVDPNDASDEGESSRFGYFLSSDGL